MSLQLRASYGVPEETARVARAAFPKGNIYMQRHEELGALYTDERFAGLFPPRGQPAESPARLALVLGCRRAARPRVGANAYSCGLV